MKDSNVWDIAYWNPTDEVTDEELQRFLDSGVGTASSNPKCYSVRQFVEDICRAPAKPTIHGIQNYGAE